MTKAAFARRWPLGAAFLSACLLACSGAAPKVGVPMQTANGNPDAGRAQPGERDAGASDGSSPEAKGDASASLPDAAGSEDAGKPDSGSFVGFYDNVEGVPLVPLIDSATTSLDIEIYELFDRGVQAAIGRALQRNVQVRMVAEPTPVGEPCHPFDAMDAKDVAACTGLKQLIQDVKDHGGNAVPFNKSELCTSASCVEHGKLVVADSKYAFVSTGNFNASNLCDAADSPGACNRDFSMIIDDKPVIATLQAVFEHDLAGVAYDLAPLISATADTLTVSPLSKEPLLAFVRSAQRSLRVTNQYLHDADLNAAIVEVAKRGVNVQVVVSSFCWFGTPTTSAKNKETAIFTAFDEAGIKSRTFTGLQMVGGHKGYNHAKAMVVDDIHAWVGSVNGSTAAMTLNREFGLFFDHQDWLATLVGAFDKDFADPNSESWQESLACTKDP